MPEASSQWERFAWAGVTDDLPLLDQYSVVITNISIAIAQATNLTLLVGIPAVLGRMHRVPSGVLLLAAALYAMAYALIARRRYFAGRFLFSSAVVAVVLTITLYFGAASALHFLFLPIGVGALMIWPQRRRAQFTLASVAFGAFLAVWIAHPAGALQDWERARLLAARIDLANVLLAFVVTFTVAVFLVRTSEQLQRHLDALRMKATDLTSRREEQMLTTVNALALARDRETGNHVIRTQMYVNALVSRLLAMGRFPDRITPRTLDIIVKAAPLHDVGKIGIADSVLLKPGRFDPGEWDAMKAHTIIGESVLASAVAVSGLDGLHAHDDVIRTAISIAGAHHERWDGTGYPRGLRGEAIPLEARIMAVADTYDALISARPYKEEWTHVQAAEEIQAGAGTRFDPDVVEAFMAEKDRFKEIARRHLD